MNKTLQEQLQEVKNTMIGETKDNNKYVGEHIENRVYDEFGNILDLKDIKRGDSLLIDLGNNSVGSEQAGTRWAICIQNNVGNKYSPTIIVAFATSKLTKSQLPTHTIIKAGQFGFKEDSIILLEQVRTIDKKRIIARKGHVDNATMQLIDNAKDISMSELKPKSLLERLQKDMRDYIITTLKDVNEYEITVEKMKYEDMEKSSISFMIKKKLLLLDKFIKYCKQNQLDYEAFYKLNHGVNKEVLEMSIALD